MFALRNICQLLNVAGGDYPKGAQKILPPTLAVFLLIAGLGLATAVPAVAQVDAGAAVRCSEHHGFGAEPVDVAKTADNSRVLAQAHWGYNDQHNICYLVLDDAALGILWDSADRMPDPILEPDPSAAARCSEHHGFGGQPVDIAKTVDNSVVLAQAYWGYNDQHNICYLVLDDAALGVLRDSAVVSASTARDGVLPPSAELASTSSRMSEDSGGEAVRYVRVDYCGPSSSSSTYSSTDLGNEVRQLQIHVDGFFERQSGYDEGAGNARRTRLVFEAGYLLHPAISWDGQSIGGWFDQYVDAYGSSQSYSDPCRKEAQSRGKKETAVYPDVLILADVDGTEIVGYARQDGGPALAATRNRHPGGVAGYLETVAHEIGHAFYDLSHPWADLFGHSDPDDLSPREVQKYLHEHVDEAQSLMSYYYIQDRPTGKRHDIRASAPSEKRAYVACYQRRDAGWTVGADCEFPDLTPETPDPPTVAPGNQQITVSWRAPNERGADITEYHVQFQSEFSSTWTDLDWEWEVGTPLRTTIGGLDNGTTYFVRIQAENRVGKSPFFSAPASGTPNTARPPTVTLSVGDGAQGASGADGTCTSAHCRWLHVEVENFGPGPHTLACAHNGVGQIGASRGVYHSDVFSGSSALRSCLFGYPGSEVFVIIGAELRGGSWHGGVYSNVVVWPHAETPDRPEVRISWGGDASNREVCPTGQECLNLDYEFIGDWGIAPYTLECWDNNRKTWEGQWSGRKATGCLYWGGPGQTAQVVIDGIPSNTITWSEGTLPTTEVRISSGSDASSRAACPQGRSCVNLRYEYIGDWSSPPYSLECWSNGQRLWGPGLWSGRETTGCYYTTGFGQKVHAVVNGIQSNTITIP